MDRFITVCTPLERQQAVRLIPMNQQFHRRLLNAFNNSQSSIESLGNNEQSTVSLMGIQVFDNGENRYNMIRFSFGSDEAATQFSKFANDYKGVEAVVEGSFEEAKQYLKENFINAEA